MTEAVCARCALHCRGKSSCGVVDPERGDEAPWRALWLSVLRVEDVPLAHTCPGGAAARLMLAGSPWRCRLCSWRDYTDPRAVEQRELAPRELSRLRVIEPSVFLLDGGEPLVQDWALQLPEILRREVPGLRYVLARTAGLLALDRLRQAHDMGFDGLVFEYLLAVEQVPRPDHVAEALREAHRVFDIIEIHVPFDGSPRSQAVVGDLAERYPETPIHVLPAEGVEDKAYRLVEKLREKGRVYVYLYPDESYTLTDTLCNSCGSPLVSRKPWGIRVYAKEGDAEPRCPRCGAPQPRLRLCRIKKRGALHREVIIW
ncbi:hypothetical protein Pyrde_1318 [Pyrodictium delaneyi]|uniref:Uncharacterized protein n=1 Tax=Pyrodictium delaneyi TaxID=1273541 RepID=A0A0P0N4L4_9CREN|nr:hypothetical protein [Pyrodictium delaneyi]ALL01364.1 hypothetical protein Pyrde_1318 [Pyrodictium delaneyi]